MTKTATTGKAFCLLLGFIVYLSLLAPMAQAQRTSQHPVFDADDRLAVLVTYAYDSADVVQTRQLQSFDRQGRLLRTELYTVDEQLLFTEQNRYDRHGNRTRCLQTAYDEEGTATQTLYKYKYSRQPDGTWKLVSLCQNGSTVYTVNPRQP